MNTFQSRTDNPPGQFVVSLPLVCLIENVNPEPELSPGLCYSHLSINGFGTGFSLCVTQFDDLAH
ncbi:hypothetical protein ERD95_05660 [Enterobacteriaceae bacterium ML5]|nr:hypothetical protein ERD95_05660 [Enterobacteriaceae bacterium ML5]